MVTHLMTVTVTRSLPSATAHRSPQAPKEQVNPCIFPTTLAWLYSGIWLFRSNLDFFAVYVLLLEFGLIPSVSLRLPSATDDFSLCPYYSLRPSRPQASMRVRCSHSWWLSVLLREKSRVISWCSFLFWHVLLPWWYSQAYCAISGTDLFACDCPNSALFQVPLVSQSRPLNRVLLRHKRPPSSLSRTFILFHEMILGWRRGLLEN